ncbi:MAG: hypothetical protein ACK5MP_07610 [Nostocoides sp.]
MNADGSLADPHWNFIGRTCVPDAVPSVAKRPSMAMIIKAFHDTKFATATMGFQPKGNLTLVNLPNFYAARWGAAGYGPGQVDALDPATMLGYQVQIRPKVISYVYHYGDGEHSGPTDSPGGTYPEGDIRHTYRKVGQYTAQITLTWGADYRIDAGPWLAIPDQVSVNQPATTIDVREAHNHLIP